MIGFLLSFLMIISCAFVLLCTHQTPAWNIITKCSSFIFIYLCVHFSFCFTMFVIALHLPWMRSKNCGGTSANPVLILLFNEIVCEKQCTQMIMLYLLSRVQDHHCIFFFPLFSVVIINRQFICSSSMDDANKSGYKKARKQFIFACNAWRKERKITFHCL